MVSTRGWVASRWYLPVAVGLTALGIAALSLQLAVVIPQMDPATLGVDFHQYLGHAQRWLDGGSFYLDRQLQGPYEIQGGDSLYPPTLLYLLVPFALGLPQLLWWAAPITIAVVAIAWLRPAPWTWPLMAGLLAVPRTYEMILYGNPGIWVAAAIAAGTVLGWPSVGVLIKPSLAPFALFGIRTRAWWIALGLYLLACLPFGLMWLEWIQVITDSDANLAYSLVDLPLMLLPVVAWAGRRSRSASTAISSNVSPNASG